MAASSPRSAGARLQRLVYLLEAESGRIRVGDQHNDSCSGKCQLREQGGERAREASRADGPTDAESSITKTTGACCVYRQKRWSITSNQDYKMLWFSGKIGHCQVDLIDSTLPSPGFNSRQHHLLTTYFLRLDSGVARADLACILVPFFWRFALLKAVAGEGGVHAMVARVREVVQVRSGHSSFDRRAARSGIPIELALT